MKTFFMILAIAVVLGSLVAWEWKTNERDHSQCNAAIVTTLTIHGQVRVAYRRLEPIDSLLDREAEALSRADVACVSWSRRSE